MYNKYKGMSDGTIQLSVLQPWMLSHVWLISLISQALKELAICYLFVCPYSLPRGLCLLWDPVLFLPLCLRGETFAETLVSLAWLMSSGWHFILTFSPRVTLTSLYPHHSLIHISFSTLIQYVLRSSPGGNSGPVPQPSRTLAHSPETPGSSITEPEVAVCLLPHRAGLDTYTHFHWHLVSFWLWFSLSILGLTNLSFRLFQSGTEPFNRAMLFNVGYKEAMKDLDWDCLIFHDVDHLMENDRNYYGCTDMPRHFAVKLDKYYYMWVVVF